MAHGAPDHTRLADDAFSRYDYKRPSSGGWNMVIAEKRSLIDLDMVGVFGWVYVVLDNIECLLKVEIDDVEVFVRCADSIFNDQHFQGRCLEGVAGCHVYDTINDIYGLWFNCGWAAYIHNHLNVELYNMSLNPCLVEIIQTCYREYTG